MPGKRPCCGTILQSECRIVPDDADVLRRLNDELVPRNGADSFASGDYICKSHFKNAFSSARFRATKKRSIFDRWFKSSDGLDLDLLRVNRTEDAGRLARLYAREADVERGEDEGDK